MRIAPATEADLPGILEIYNHEILHNFAHFGLEPYSLQDLATELATVHWPWLVAADDGVVGFARATNWRPRAAYARTVEVSVYVHPQHRGRGIAHALYAEFIPLLKPAGAHTALAGIAQPNPASVRLHEEFGFRHVGTLPEVGFKLGAWRDVGYWARVFAD